jgi:hypothetical protein
LDCPNSSGWDSERFCNFQLLHFRHDDWGTRGFDKCHYGHTWRHTNRSLRRVACVSF